MARTPRQIEHVEFTVDGVATIVQWMARLAAATDGWINLVPKVAENEDRPTSLGFLTLLGGGSAGVTMCTWIPRSYNRRGSVLASVGITQVTGRRAVAQLFSLGVPIPETWFVEQDHPRRGLVLRLPENEPHEGVLEWSLRAVSALCVPQPARTWRADIYLPITS
ncbi:MAG: hypothetical protein ABSG36_13140 [Acidimicrobiales bacterium]